MSSITLISDNDIACLRNTIIDGYKRCLDSANELISTKIFQPITWLLPCANIWLMFPNNRRNLLITIDPNLLDASLQNQYLDSVKSLEYLDYVYITHLHSDHYNPSVLNILADRFGKCSFIVPQPFYKRIASETNTAVTKRIIAITNKAPVNIDQLTISAIPLPHIIIEHCYGYIFEDNNNRKMRKIFVASDIRDYTKAKPIQADVLFFSMWLGRLRASCPDSEITENAARYISAIAPKKLFFYHLYDIGRNPNDIWHKEHCKLVIKHLNLDNYASYIPQPSNFGTKVEL